MLSDYNSISSINEQRNLMLRNSQSMKAKIGFGNPPSSNAATTPNYTFFTTKQHHQSKTKMMINA